MEIQPAHNTTHHPIVFSVLETNWAGANSTKVMHNKFIVVCPLNSWSLQNVVRNILCGGTNTPWQADTEEGTVVKLMETARSTTRAECSIKNSDKSNFTAGSDLDFQRLNTNRRKGGRRRTSHTPYHGEVRTEWSIHWVPSEWVVRRWILSSNTLALVLMCGVKEVLLVNSAKTKKQTQPMNDGTSGSMFSCDPGVCDRVTVN